MAIIYVEDEKQQMDESVIKSITRKYPSFEVTFVSKMSSVEPVASQVKKVTEL